MNFTGVQAPRRVLYQIGDLRSGSFTATAPYLLGDFGLGFAGLPVRQLRRKS